MLETEAEGRDADDELAARLEAGEVVSLGGKVLNSHADDADAHDDELAARLEADEVVSLGGKVLLVMLMMLPMLMLMLAMLMMLAMVMLIWSSS